MTLVEFISSVKFWGCNIFVAACDDPFDNYALEEGRYIYIGDDTYNDCDTEEDVYNNLDLPEGFEPWLEREVLDVHCEYNKVKIRKWVDRGYSKEYEPKPALIIFIEEESSDEMLWNDDILETKLDYTDSWPFIPREDGWKIKEEDWPYKLPYDVFQKVDEILSYNLFLGMCIIDNIVLHGFNWAKAITDEDIEEERERDRQKDEEIERENEEREKKGIMYDVIRTDSGLSVAIMEGARELANILETHTNWMSYFLISTHFRSFLIEK